MNQNSFKLVQSSNDDESYFSLVGNVVSNLVDEMQPKEVRIIKVGNWFGPKWLGFSGVVALQVSVWKSQTTFPPFDPNRIETEVRFTKSGDSYKAEDKFTKTHMDRPSRDNVRNYVSSAFEDGMLFWYAGNTKKNGRGCIMVYAFQNESMKSFYVGFYLGRPTA